jgi:hypothetical protein
MGIQKTVTVEVEGKSYTAKYSLKNEKVTIMGKGTEATTLKTTTLLSGPAKAKEMARILLEEMVEAGRVIPD